jgi:hypothetical protein
MGDGTSAMQADRRDGTLAEFAFAPGATVTPAEGLDALAATRGAQIAPVPYGQLRRARLAAPRVASGARRCRPAAQCIAPLPDHICSGNYAAANARIDELLALADESGAMFWKAWNRNVGFAACSDWESLRCSSGDHFGDHLTGQLEQFLMNRVSFGIWHRPMRNLWKGRCS